MINGHAKWSPSGSPRWLKCSASVTAVSPEALARDTSSPAAERGTMLHELAADVLTGQIDQNDPAAALDVMAIVDYVNYVRDHEEDFNNQIHIEVNCHLTPITGEDGATGAIDALVVNDKLLKVIDLKTGMHPVEPSSSQLMIYGAACCYEIEYNGPVELIVHQGGHAKVHETHSETLLAYAAGVRQYVAMAEQAALKGKHSYNAGEDQCRFCPHVIECQELQSYRNALAAQEFSVPEDTDKLADDLEMIPPLMAWAKAVQEHAQGLALKGNEIPGYKLVRANTMRKWVGEEELVAVLGDAAYDRKLIGIGAGEKLLDAETMNALTIKPEGQPVLVPASDKRPAITSDAADDFKDA